VNLSIQLAVGASLVLLLLVLAGYYAWRQRNTLRMLRTDTSLSGDDRAYLRRQVRLRILCSILMMVFAAMLVGWFFLEGNLREIKAQVPQAELNPEQRESLRLLGLYVVALMVVLAAILLLAALDFLGTAKFGLRHQRLLEADRKVMLEKQAALLRQQRRETEDGQQL
jgi:hypothetical protein